MTDQEIRDALRVDPSPEFLARVRTRIASEPAPSAWRWSWRVAAAGALAAALVVAVLLPRLEQSAPQPVPQTRIVQGSVPVVSGSTAVATTSVRPAPASRSAEGFALHVDSQTALARLKPDATPGVSGFPPPLQSSSAELRRGQAEAQSAKAGSRTVTREAEVLLDPAETRALRSLIAGVRDGRVDLAAAQRSVPLAPMEPAPIIAIDIAPLGIEPIAPPSGAEGVRP